jgi:hydroxyacid-oxoacid transhydrogenase
MGVDVTEAHEEDAGEILAQAIIDLMRRTGMPNGLGAVGFEPDDVDALVEGTLPQHRVTKLAPRPADPEDLRRLFLGALRYW